MEFSQMQLAGAGGGDLAASAAIPVPPMVQYSMGEGSLYPRNRKKKHSKTMPQSGEPNRTQYHWYLFEQPDFPDEANGKAIKSATTGTSGIPARHKSVEPNNYREARTTSTTTRKPTIGGYYTGSSDNYPNVSWPNYSYAPHQPSNYYMNHYDSLGWGEETTDIKEPLIEKVFGTLGLLLIPLAGLILLPLLLFPVISLVLFALPGIPIPVIISEMPEADNSTTAPMMMMNSSSSNSETSTFTSMSSTMTESTIMMTQMTPTMQNRTDGATTAKHFGYVNVKLLKPTKRPTKHKNTALSNDNLLTLDGPGFPFLFLNETFEDMHNRRNGKY